MNTKNKRVFKTKEVSRTFNGIFVYILMSMNTVRNRIQIIVKTMAERAS